LWKNSPNSDRTDDWGLAVTFKAAA
jgi:hypothetical protein